MYDAATHAYMRRHAGRAASLRLRAMTGTLVVLYSCVLPAPFCFLALFAVGICVFDFWALLLFPVITVADMVDHFSGPWES